jgi:hypothetical protein
MVNYEEIDLQFVVSHIMLFMYMKCHKLLVKRYSNLHICIQYRTKEGPGVA